MKEIDKAWLNEIAWQDNQLIPVIAQDYESGRVLMAAWMNRDALLETVKTGNAVYFSRSKQRLWQKGEESGHYQRIREIRLDCDADVLLLSVTQEGGIACHTGRNSCFFRLFNEGQWQIADPVLKDPLEIYKNE